MKKTKKLLSIVAAITIMSSMASIPASAATVCGDGCVMYSTFSSFGHYNSCPSCKSNRYTIKGYKSCSNWSSRYGGFNDVDYVLRKCTNCGRTYKGPQYLHKVTWTPLED